METMAMQWFLNARKTKNKKSFTKTAVWISMRQFLFEKIFLSTLKTWKGGFCVQKICVVFSGHRHKMTLY